MKYLLFFIALSSSLQASSEIERRVQAHLTINNALEAKKEVDKALELDPTSKTLLACQIRIFATLQDEACMLKAWNTYNSLYKDDPTTEKLLEEMCWAIICKGAEHGSPIIRFEATGAAFYSQDAKGIPLIVKTLQDHNVNLKLFALFIASHLRDEVIEDQVINLAFHDSSPHVRQKAIETLGAMRSKKSKKQLQARLSQESSSIPFEELQASTEAVANIISDWNEEYFDTLLKSKKSPERMLACRYALIQYKKESAQKLKPLIKDSSLRVRAFALQTLGALEIPLEAGEIVPLTENSSDPLTAISACYALMRCQNDMKVAEKCFSYWTNHKNQEIRLLAIGALTQTGSKSILLSKNILTEDETPFVRINVAMNLIRQREIVDIAASLLQKTIEATKDRLQWHQSGIFKYIGKSTQQHNAMIPRYPEACDFACRLELYGILATCPNYMLKDSLKEFLRERSWGIAAMTASLLLQEGDDTTFDIVRSLLQEEMLEVRLQAAFIMAMTTQDEEARKILEQDFAKAPRELQEVILLGIGAIGSKKSLPFLVKTFDEPSPVLRIRAASSVLQCLYH